MTFGESESLTCITHVEIQGPDDEPLCLAYKTTTQHFLAPVYLTDDGYVLAIEAPSPTQYLPLPEGAELIELQDAGLLPAPLPAYQIPTLDYVFGHLLWVILAVIAVIMVIGHRLKQANVASLQTFAPPNTDKPEPRTKTDHWLAEEADKLLAPGEYVQQQAYGTDHVVQGWSGAINGKGLYALLTNQRLVLITTRLGAFRPLRENRGVKAIPRGEIVRVDADERYLRFVLVDGSIIELYVQWSERALSNQRRFLMDVPRMLGRSDASAHAT